jgi:hypothetical protein
MRGRVVESGRAGQEAGTDLGEATAVRRPDGGGAPSSFAGATAGPASGSEPNPGQTSLDRHATYIVVAYVAGAARQKTDATSELRLAGTMARRRPAAIGQQILRTP